MELLLNLLWFAIALIALYGFARTRRGSRQLRQVSYITPLIALACVLVLLFPIVSASDDLHPTQAIVEDANKRIQQVVTMQPAQTAPLLPMVPLLRTICMLFSLLFVRFLDPAAAVLRAVDGQRTPMAERAPPTLFF